jgi:hypothetical protein
MFKQLRPCPVCGTPMPLYAVVDPDGQTSGVRICAMGEVVAVPGKLPGRFKMGLPPGSQHTIPGRLWSDLELDIEYGLVETAVA